MIDLQEQRTQRITSGKDLSKTILKAIDIISEKYGTPVSSKDFNYGLVNYFYVDKSKEVIDYKNDIFDYQYTVHFETIDGGACYVIELDENNLPIIVEADANASKYFDEERLCY